MHYGYTVMIDCTSYVNIVSLFFGNFIHPSIRIPLSSWFFPHIDLKRGRYTVTKFSVILSVQYVLAFISSFFDREFTQSRKFYENTMTLWFYQIRPKVVWKMVHGLMDTRTKTKTIPNTKNKSPLFFRTVYHSKNHVNPHHVITAILVAILII